MKKLLRLVSVLGLMALGFWAWTFLFPSPQHIIRNKLNKLARLATCPAGEGNISRAIDIEKLGVLFADDVQVAVDVPGTEPHTFVGKGELMQGFSMVKTSGTGIKVEFPDINIGLSPNAASARVDLTLKARIEGQSDLIVQEMKFTLDKTNGDWLITRAETVATLKP